MLIGHFVKTCRNISYYVLHNSHHISAQEGWTSNSTPRAIQPLGYDHLVPPNSNDSGGKGKIKKKKKETKCEQILAASCALCASSLPC